MLSKTNRSLPIALSTVIFLTCLFLCNQDVKAQENAAKKDSSSQQTARGVDVIPNFPGDFSKFVRRNLDQTKASQSGRINVTFIIEKDGSLSDVKAVGRIFDQNAANEAVRIMKLSTKWNPGIQNGNLVRVQYTVPVVFD
jgi:hypothetical protein